MTAGATQARPSGLWFEAPVEICRERLSVVCKLVLQVLKQTLLSSCGAVGATGPSSTQVMSSSGMVPVLFPKRAVCVQVSSQ